MSKDVAWTPPIMERLRELHDQELPYSRIAKILTAEFQLRFTANSCIGKARRADFPLRLTHRQKRVVAETRKPEPKRGTRPKAAFGKAYVAPVKLKPIILAPTAPGPVSLGVPTCAVIPIDELTRFTCHWPYGMAPPYSYCGEATHRDSSFCRHHYERVYVMPAKRWN